MPNPSNAQQLLLVKAFLDEAQTLALREDTFSTSKAILFLDLAVEQMLRAIIFSLNPNLNPRKDLMTWHDLWKEVDAALQTQGLELHNHAPLKSLHEHRNMVQHAGATYHYSQARSYVVPAEEMLTQAFRDVFGLDFARYSLVALIVNDDLRQWLEHAAELLTAGKPLLAIAACNYLHGVVIDELQTRTAGRSTTWSRRLSSRDLELDHPVPLTDAIIKLDERLTDAIEALEHEVAAIGVGMSILEVRRFRAAGSVVAVTVYSDHQIETNVNCDKPFEAQRASAEFMLGYLGRLIRSIEETYESALNKLEIKVPLMEQDFIKEALESGESADENGKMPSNSN